MPGTVLVPVLVSLMASSAASSTLLAILPTPLRLCCQRREGVVARRAGIAIHSVRKRDRAKGLRNHMPAEPNHTKRASGVGEQRKEKMQIRNDEVTVACTLCTACSQEMPSKKIKRRKKQKEKEKVMHKQARK